MTENDAFDRYHNALKLPPEEVAFARTFPDLVKEILAESPEITVSHSFLQGSLDRGTMVPPLKDVDMVSTLDRERHGEFLDDPEGPERAMDLFERVLEEPLRRRFPRMAFTGRTAHAVQFDLGPGLPSFDLVPAFEESEPPGQYGNVFIADCEDQAWEWANPRQLRHQVAKCNQACNGRLIHVCRMVKNPLKHDEVLNGFPGLVVEALACDCLSGAFSCAEGVAALLAEGAARIGQGAIYDPTGVDDLAVRLDEKGLTRPAQEWFTRAADEAARARRAAEIGDHESALRWWYRVLGDPFPLPEDSAVTSSETTTVVDGLTTGRLIKPTRAAGELDWL